MSKRNKQIATCVLFVPAIVGALVPSYLHLAAWYEAWMPEGWERLSYVAALVTEAPVIACGLSAILMPQGIRLRLPVYGLLAYSVAVSIYVNARWAWGHVDTPTGDAAWWGKALDVTLGSAVLPLFALFGELVLDVVLREVQGGDVKPAPPKPERKQAQAPASSPAQAPVAAGLAVKWAAVVARHGADKNLTQLAQLEGVTRQAVSQWRKAATGGLAE